MGLRLTNTLTNKLEEFKSLIPNKVSIYCCGVTVYDLCHLGHARSYVVWDVLRRLLIWEGYEVTFVQNFTDIDDKILNRANKDNSTMEEVSEKNIQAFYKDMDALGIIRPDKMPRATKCLDEIQLLIKQLEDKGAAYSKDGDVYFSVEKNKAYGKLSKRNLNEQKVNADGRLIDQDNKKRNSSDFALWKKAKKGEPSFQSPWGQGRPGWHIECSAMVRKELGETIDIHLGGADLIFPHHENEIAQSETANNNELAKYWLHNGMVNVDGKKMSKSLGNFTTIRSLLASGVSPMTLRLFILQANYRKPLDFTNEALESAEKGWQVINSALLIGFNNASLLDWPKSINNKTSKIQIEKETISSEFLLLYNKFIDSMNNDLNTSGALSVIFELAKPLKSISNQIKRGDHQNIKATKELYLRWQTLCQLCGVLGLSHEYEPIKSLELNSSKYPEEFEIKNAITLRLEAKKSKDYSSADRIRSELKTKGIELIDKPDGSTEWIRS